MNPYHLIFILLTSCVCISCRPVEDENNHNNITFYNGLWDSFVYCSRY